MPSLSFHVLSGHKNSDFSKLAPRLKSALNHGFVGLPRGYVLSTVEPPVSGHPRDQKKCPLKRGVHLREDKNVVFVCGWDDA